MGVDAYLAVAFWVGIVAIIGKILTIIWSEYPRVEKSTVGHDVIHLLLSISFFVWVCFLRFGSNP